MGFAVSRICWGGIVGSAVLVLSSVLGADDHRRQNPALLGVLTAPGKKGLEVLSVLPGSPADAQGLEPGDRVVRVNGEKLSRPRQLDAALSKLAPAEVVKLRVVREKETRELAVKLVARQDYWARHRPQSQGGVGQSAPAWHAYGWRNLPRGAAGPTLASTRGRVVVIHAFQGW